jgi:two-component system phosphate regulon sensor histidine kinase PhoR
MIRSLLPDTIRGQVTLAFALLCLLLSLPFAWLLVDAGRDDAVHARKHAFVRQTSQAATLLAADDTATELQAALTSLAELSGDSWAVYDPDGEVVATAVPSDDPVPAGFPPVISADQLRRTLVEKNGLAFSTETIPGDEGLTLLAATDAESLRGNGRSLWKTALAGMLILVPIYGLAGWWVAGRISKPFVALRDQSLAVATGQRQSVEMQRGSRGIRDLVATINALSAQVTELTVDREDTVRRLELIFENLREGVIVVDEDEVVIAENAYARELLGNQGRAGIGMPVAVVIRDHDLLDQMREVRAELEPSTIPIDYVRSGRSIEATVIPLQASQAYSVVVLRDVTELRKLESVRREFVANVSHELRTPLASIRALADTLESGALDDRGVATDFLSKIVREVDRLTALVDELLDLARLQSGRVVLTKKPVHAGEAINAGVERLRSQIERAGLSVTLELREPLPVVVVDQSRIEQVLINLLHNAVKFTPVGGSIVVAAWAERDGLRVDVRDTGTGIPEEELSRIFERFYKGDRSRRSDGSGLGLAISKHIIKAHRGEIWASSVPGQGSTFSFWVPAAAQPAVAEAALL